MKARDGADIAIDWYDGKPSKGCSKPILVMLPGLTGSNQSAYIKNVIRDVHSEFKCVFVWQRSQGDVPITTPKMYSLSSWEDIEDAVNYIN